MRYLTDRHGIFFYGLLKYVLKISDVFHATITIKIGYQAAHGEIYRFNVTVLA